MQVLVEVSALDDFELAVPLAPMYARALPTSESEVRFQSGKVEKITGASSSQYTMGESINSLKQLIMIPKISSCGQIPANTTQSSLMLPWFYSPTVIKGEGAAPTSNPREAFSFGGAISKCYTYVRGSTDVHAYPNETATNSILMWANQTPLEGNTSAAVANSPENTSGVNVPRVFSGRGSTLHVRFPCYSRYVRIRGGDLDTPTWFPNVGGAANLISYDPNLNTAPQQVPKLYFQNVGTTTTQVYVTRSAGDDAMCGLFIGAPPLLLLSTNTGTSWDPDSVGFN